MPSGGWRRACPDTVATNAESRSEISHPADPVSFRIFATQPMGSAPLISRGAPWLVGSISCRALRG